MEGGDDIGRVIPSAQNDLEESKELQSNSIDNQDRKEQTVDETNLESNLAPLINTESKQEQELPKAEQSIETVKSEVIPSVQENVEAIKENNFPMIGHSHRKNSEFTASAVDLSTSIILSNAYKTL